VAEVVGKAEASTTTAIVVPLAIAAACWIGSVKHMDGMDMGTATMLGSFASFAPLWAAMMAAMMLPGAIPAVGRHSAGHGARAVPLFVASYLAVWALLGVAVYALYEPHGHAAAGTIVIAAGLYELTPVKRYYRRRCHEQLRSGLQFGYCCVGSSIGLMLVLLALGVMNVGWMAAVTAAALAQKLLPAKAALDVPLALAIVALGIGIVVI
jgi:predicted metal-binding membrane protein